MVKSSIMELIILGSGTAIPSLKRGSPGLVVKVGEKSILFDSGSGTLVKLLAAGITLLDLDYAFYSHFHPDHTADLVPLLFALRNPEMQRTKPLYVAGPLGFLDFYQGLKGVYGDWVEPTGFELVIEELGEGKREYEGFVLFTRRVSHSGYSLGFRLEAEEGKSLAYSGDSDYCESLIELGRGVDVFVMECAFPDEEHCPGHLTPSLAGQIAAQAGCKRLVLTHFYPACEGKNLITPCQKYYQGEIILAEDLMRLSW